MAVIRIRGLGLLTSYGLGLAHTVEGLRAARDGSTPLTAFSLPFQAAMRVNQYDHSLFPAGSACTTAAMQAVVDEALNAAGWTPADGIMTALLVGTSSFLFAGESDYRLNLAATGEAVIPAVKPPARVALELAEHFGARGPVLTLTTACSSSANALTVAATLLHRGAAQRAIVIGIEGLSAGALTGFYSMMLLDPEGCRPFDAARRGMQIGEAAGAVLLEAEPAQQPGGDYFLGGANLCDTHHMTSASPDGSAMRRVMELALENAGLTPADISLIKAHGTGSQDNDMAEAAAMRGLFGQQLPPFTGLKRYLGHTLGACGTVELAALLGCLRAGFVPPTLGCTTVDPALQVKPLDKPLPAPSGASMLNTFGFGGNYASLILRHG